MRLGISIDFLTDAKGVSCSSEIEQLREKVYGTLEEYSRTAYPDEPGRFAKLLLRLPALRSIGSYCVLSYRTKIYTGISLSHLTQNGQWSMEVNISDFQSWIFEI